LSKIDENVFGNIRERNFKEETISNAFNKLKKKTGDLNSYALSWYKKSFLYEKLKTLLQDGCQSFENKSQNTRTTDIKESFIINCQKVIGKNLTEKYGFKNKIEDICNKYEPLLSKLLPRENFNTRDYKVIYGIITPKKHNDLTEALPFFSRLNLMGQAQDIKNAGYEVFVKLIKGEK
jgi:hypothetical protein